ncbi:DUF202 domain-containing protein [Streptomyces sp. NPDC020965]|uniref:DUF202 domain-containing protein n=1 Tax=Streptomyces sp. NPDC020965 TaxID=3365105 RepID=UPI003797B46F
MTTAVRDPGLQPERTRLAWRRTTLSFTVVAVLAVRQGLNGDGPDAAGIVAVALSVLVWLGFLLVTHGRIRVLGAGPRPPALSTGAALAAAGCAVALAGLAVVMIL